MLPEILNLRQKSRIFLTWSQLATISTFILNTVSLFPLQLNCTDGDLELRNNLLTYSIHGGDGLFQVSQSGEVTLSGNLDAELHQSYTLLVVASDPHAR